MNRKKLVVGLGNPGPRYAKTPHNLGFEVVDLLAAELAATWKWQDTVHSWIASCLLNDWELLLAKPQTYMNLSGVAIKPLLQKNELTAADLILLYDDLDLPWGSIRVKRDGRAAGHNGVIDTIDKLGTQEFKRVRLGVHPGVGIKTGKDYLLSRFTRWQTESLDAFVDLGADATESIITEGVEKSMTRFNRRAQGESPEEQ